MKRWLSSIKFLSQIPLQEISTIYFMKEANMFLFHHSGGPRLYTSSYPFMKEGLADFFSYLYSHQYGRDIPKPFHYDPVRDITRSPSLRWKNASLRSLLDRRGYRSGLFVSHLLWKVTLEIGEKEMEKFSRPLLDNLNLFHKHLEEETIDDHLEYILAVLKGDGPRNTT